jgi:hypothetical protein
MPPRRRDRFTMSAKKSNSDPPSLEGSTTIWFPSVCLLAPASYTFLAGSQLSPPFVVRVK